MKTTTIASIIRHLLGFAGGYFAAKGIELDAGAVDAISGGLAAIAAVAWSLWEKRAKS